MEPGLRPVQPTGAVDARGGDARGRALGVDGLWQGQGTLAALIALAAAVLVATVVFTMPPGHAVRAAILGVVTGLFPIGWIVLNVIFLYRLTVETGLVRGRCKQSSAASPPIGGCNSC